MCNQKESECVHSFQFLQWDRIKNSYWQAQPDSAAVGVVCKRKLLLKPTSMDHGYRVNSISVLVSIDTQNEIKFQSQNLRGNNVFYQPFQPKNLAQVFHHHIPIQSPFACRLWTNKVSMIVAQQLKLRKFSAAGYIWRQTLYVSILTSLIWCTKLCWGWLCSVCSV